MLLNSRPKILFIFENLCQISMAGQLCRRAVCRQTVAVVPFGRLSFPSLTLVVVRPLSGSSTMLGDESSSRQKAEIFRQRLRERIDDVKDNIKTVPNALCIASWTGGWISFLMSGSQLRPVCELVFDLDFGENFILGLADTICSMPLIGYLVVHEHFMPACALFVVSGVTDLLDGWIARWYPSQRSMIGSILDPLADKLLINTLVVTLTYVQLIPLALAMVILGRDVLLISGGLVRRYQILEPPITLSRFFNPHVSSVHVTPTFASKVNTALQLGLVSLSLASPVFGFQDHPLLTILCVCTGATTVYSGFQYASGSAMMPIRKIVERVERKQRST